MKNQKRCGFEIQFAREVNKLVPTFAAAMVSGVIARNEALTDETWAWILPQARKMAIQTAKDQYGNS